MRERKHMHKQGRGREREGERESQAGCTSWAQMPNRGLDPTNREIMTWVEIKNWMLNQPTEPRHPIWECVCVCFNFLTLIYFLRDRETEHEWGRGKERGKHRIWSRLRALSCQHRAWHGAQTHQRESWPEPKSALTRLSHPGTCRECFWSKRISSVLPGRGL